MEDRGLEDQYHAAQSPQQCSDKLPACRLGFGGSRFARYRVCRHRRRSRMRLGFRSYRSDQQNILRLDDSVTDSVGAIGLDSIDPPNYRPIGWTRSGDSGRTNRNRSGDSYMTPKHKFILTIF